MRTLLPAPRTFVDPATGAPSFGSYAGPLPAVDVGGSGVTRALRRKRWCWIGLSSDEVWISLAVVHLGYATSAFAFAFDRASRRMLFDRAIVGPHWAVHVADDPHRSGLLARFALGRSVVAFERRGTCDLRVHLGALTIDASLDESDAPPPISAIARLGASASATEKRALARVRGAATIAGRTVSLDGAFGGYDYTHGILPRHTRWRWAFALGRARDGAPVAFNVVEGFVGEAECAAFRDGGVHPLAEPAFELDSADPARPWRLRGEGMDLTFDVGAVHAQRNNLGVVRTRFLQPVGTFRGTVRIDGRDVELDGLPGVVEDQDVLW